MRSLCSRLDLALRSAHAQLFSGVSRVDGCRWSSFSLHQLLGLVFFFKSCKVSRAAYTTDWDRKCTHSLRLPPPPFHKSTHMLETHREEACHKAKVGGEVKKGAFKLSALDSVSVAAGGVLSMPPTVLVSTASPRPVVNTHSHTRIWSPLRRKEGKRGLCKKSFCWGSFPHVVQLNSSSVTSGEVST